MMHPELQATEVSPFDDLEIPLYSRPGQTPTLEVLEANRQSAEKLNAARREWQLGCLEAIVGHQAAGEAQLAHLDDPEAAAAAMFRQIDPQKLNLTRRPIVTRMIAQPNLTPELDALGKAKGFLRHAGDLLTFTYGVETIGTFETAYDHSGKIGIKASIKDTDDETQS